MSHSHTNGPVTITVCPEQFNNHVDQIMTSTWHELEANAGITLHDCKEFLNEYAAELQSEIARSNKRKAKKFGAISQHTIALVHEILADFNINPNSISIVPYNGQGSPAAADNYTIYIDEKNLKTFCPEAQKFVIAHEISHYLFGDHSLESALINLIDPKNKVHKRCLHTFARSSEFRADINAMLKGAEYAKGGISFFQELLARYGDDTASSTHPRTSERLRIARDMEAMHVQQAQNYPVGVVAA